MNEDSHAGVAEPTYREKRKRRTGGDKKPRRQPRYNVILWDDQDHTPEYVVVLAQSLFGHPIEMGYQIAQQVHNGGRAILLTTTKEHAELKRDQIHAFGKDPFNADCQGSMSATIEPVPE